MKQVSSLFIFATIIFTVLLPYQVVTALPIPPIRGTTSGINNMFKRCNNVLSNNPRLFSSITSCLLFSGSDAFAQNLEMKKKVTNVSSSSSSSDINSEFQLDYPRFISAGFLGVIFGGFVYPTAYTQIDKLWKRSNFSSVLQKSVFEIATVGIFVNSISMAVRGVLLGRRGDDVVMHVWNEMREVTLNDVRVWLPYNLVAFSVIPSYLRPITTAMMESGWQTYISFKSNDYE